MSSRIPRPTTGADLSQLPPSTRIHLPTTPLHPLWSRIDQISSLGVPPSKTHPWRLKGAFNGEIEMTHFNGPGNSHRVTVQMAMKFTTDGPNCHSHPSQRVETSSAVSKVVDDDMISAVDLENGALTVARKSALSYEVRFIHPMLYSAANA